MTSIFEGPEIIDACHDTRGTFFYLNYLKFEKSVNIHSSDYDPFARLTYFHLAVLEQVEMMHVAIAYQIYLDLKQKKEQFTIDLSLSEEVNDIMQDIVDHLNQNGYPAEHFELALN